MTWLGSARSEVVRCAKPLFNERWVVATEVAVLVGQRPWSGSSACVLVTWCPSSWLTARDWTSVKGELELGAHMKKRAKPNESSASRSAVDNDFGRQYPVLYDYLTCTCWDDDPKLPRATATLLIFGQDGCFKACLRDRAESSCCWVAAPSVTELLGALERELSDGTAVWREDRLSGAPEARRKPREKSA